MKAQVTKLALLPVVLAVSFVGGFALAQSGGPTVGTQTFTHEDVVTHTVPTVTETVTVAPQPGVVLGARPLGGAQAGSPGHGLTDAAERDRIEGLIDRKFGMERIYYNWGSDWPNAYAFESASGGRVSLISFNSGGYTWAQVAAGNGDAWLRLRYRKLKTHPELASAILSYHHEPESDVAAKGPASDFVAAFRHVVTVARQEGVGNKWALTLMDFTINSGRPVEPWYPGDAYVDFIGFDIYGASVNTPTAADCDATGWESFYETTIKPYNWALSKGKPMIIPELGQREDPDNSQRKAGWIKAMRVDLKARFPNIVAFTWAHSDFGGPCAYPYAWWIDTSSQALAAFAAMANDSYFGG